METPYWISHSQIFSIPSLVYPWLLWRNIVRTTGTEIISYFSRSAIEQPLTIYVENSILFESASIFSTLLFFLLAIKCSILTKLKTIKIRVFYFWENCGDCMNFNWIIVGLSRETSACILWKQRWIDTLRKINKVRRMTFIWRCFFLLKVDRVFLN